MTFTLAIVGRPNVGKSTLFNRLAGKQLAIVDDTPGVTRDWREAEGYLLDQPIRLLDTAGLEDAFDDSIQGRMRAQTESALERADAVLFLIDGREGLTPTDEHFAQFLRKQKKPVRLAVNKCENERATQAGIAEGFKLGFGQPIPISSAHGDGINDLYDAFQEYFPPPLAAPSPPQAGGIEEGSDDALDIIEGDETFAFEDDFDDTKPIKIAIVGRPNVGKSTLVNALLEDHRVMTGPEAGITRDAIAVDWIYKDRALKLVDTAGIRKKSHTAKKIEKMSVEDSMRAIRLAQLVVLVLDGNAIFEKQDLQIADHIACEGRALIVAINKWDAVKDKKEAMEILQDKLERSLAQIKDVPTVTISALNGKNLEPLMNTVLKTYEVWNRRAATGNLNRWLAARESQHPAPLISGRPNRLKYIAQIKTRPPTFALWVSQPKKLPKDYKRYIINGLRQDFDIQGVPIRLLVRTSKNPYN